jgi:hypothetical protein
MTSNDQRSATIAAAIGLGGVLVWWMLRKEGRGPGSGGGGHGGGRGPDLGPGSASVRPISPSLPSSPIPLPYSPPIPPPIPTPILPAVAHPEIIVMIRSGDRIDLDGVASDLSHVAVATATAGRVVVRATGDARHGFIVDVLGALVSSGVPVSADMGGGGGPDLSSALGMARRDLATAEAARGASAPM